MNIDKNTLSKLADLAKLEVKPEQEEKLIDDLSQILSWVSQLQEVDTSHVSPLVNMSHEVNAMREDVVIQTLKRNDALKHAQQKDNQFFLVNKVIDK